MYSSVHTPGSRAFWNDIAQNGREIPQANIEIKWPESAEIDNLEFQNVAIRQMVYLAGMGKNILLADEMRVGKSIEICGFINALRPKKVLILCPNNLKFQWRDLVTSLLFDKYEMEVAGSSIFMFSDLVIINYEALKNFGDALKSVKWDLIIADEAHYLKNASTLRSQMTYGLTAECFIFATGSPIMNYPYEIFPLVHKLAPEVFPEASGFEYYFCWGPDGKFGRNLGVLQGVLRNTIMIRRLLKDVMTDMPSIRRKVIEIPTEGVAGVRKLLDHQKALYEKGDGQELMSVLLSAMDESKEAVDEMNFHAIIAAMTSRKRYLFEEMARVRHEVGQAKIPYVIQHLENVMENKEKTVLFGHHHDVLHTIASRFKFGTMANVVEGKKFKTVTVDGTVEVEKRYQRRTEFATDENCRLFVGSMKVAAEGLDLSASNYAIFAEQDWVPNVLNQCEARLRNLMRHSAILIEHLVFEDSMDSVMIKRAIRKQRSINKALNRT